MEAEGCTVVREERKNDEKNDVTDSCYPDCGA